MSCRASDSAACLRRPSALVGSRVHGHTNAVGPLAVASASAELPLLCRLDSRHRPSLTPLAMPVPVGAIPGGGQHGPSTLDKCMSAARLLAVAGAVAGARLTAVQ